jgi:predicted amino acid dehydrogenase
MKQIISISPGSSQRNYTLMTTMLDQPVRLQRFGTDGSLARAAELVRAFDGQAHAIALEELTPVVRLGQARYPQEAVATLVAQARQTPVVDGSLLRATLERWAVKRATDMLPGLLRYRRILLTSGIQQYQLAQMLTQYNASLRFADPLLMTGLPFPLVPRSLAQLEQYAAVALPLAALMQATLQPRYTFAAQQQVRQLFTWADVIVGDAETICRSAPANMRGRTVITTDPTPADIDDLRNRGVSTLVTMTPPLGQERPFVATAALEGMITAVWAQADQPLDEAAILDFIDDAGWEPTVQHLSSEHHRPTFAFVVHPLTVKHIYIDKRFNAARYLPQRLVEWLVSFAPPLYLSRMRGIRSKATGQEVEGLLLTLGATAREIMRRRPGFTYRRLIQAARVAERRGARVMGLGAFTSVVGDAGITVAQKVDIGVTSGNSLTVAATLESAKRAVQLMGGRTDQGRAMVIGATGSIGSVCARLLAQAVGDVIIVAPRPERLLTLKQLIERETPGARVVATTNSTDYIGEADLVVTTTSALKGGLVNVDRLKPGAVVCDVARPANVHKEDAARRPDVLVIESGEIVLPGKPDFGFDIALPPGTAYACLAETAVLAMEGKFEDYTLGREIEMERVKEMYRLMQKHGLELAGLRSFGREVTDEVIAEKRRLAEERRQKLGLTIEEMVGAEV